MGSVGLVVLAVTLLDGCAHKLVRSLRAPDEASTLDGKSKYLKVHMRNGDLYVLSDWRVSEKDGVVSGTGAHYGPNRAVLEPAAVHRIPLADVALFETNVEKVSGSVAAVTVMAVLSGAVTIACLTHPKACFGSCPTFYVTDGEREILQAEGFSDSVAPSLEASDLDALYLAEPTSSRIEVRVTNEALETHVIRHVELVAARRPAGGRVFATGSGELWNAVEIRPPAACRAEEGSCVRALQALDGLQRFSRTNGVDLASRETVELEFAGRRPEARLGIVIGARQTLLSTFLFYQALAFMGRSATGYLARLERGDAGLEREISGMHDVLGGVEVQIASPDGDWVTVGQYDETGPIATDVQLVLLPAGVHAERIRLRMTRGLWRIDYVALAEVRDRALATRLRPVAVRSADGNGMARLGRLLDSDQTLVTYPGEEHTLIFELPDSPDGAELFLDSEGYYLEWMREEWMKEENPLAAALMLYAPRLALRLLAPAFEKLEPHMERLFWSSRYEAE